MTRRNSRRRRWLQDKAIRAVLSGVISCGLVTSMVVLPTAVMTGCKKKKPPAPPPPPPPPPPALPEPIQIDPVLQSLKPDARVQFPQSRATVDESLAKAVIALCDAFAKGDADKLATLLAPAAKADLDTLVSNGDWEESVKRLEAVRVVFTSELPGDALPSTGGQIVLAFQEPGGSYVVGFNALNNGGAWVFDGTGTTPGKKNRANEWDGLTIDDLTKATAVAEAAEPAGSSQTMPTEGKLIRFAMIEVALRVAQDAGIDRTVASGAIAGALQMDPAEIASIQTEGKALVDAGTKIDPEKLGHRVLAGLEALKLLNAGWGNKVTEEQLIRYIAEALKEDPATVTAKLAEARADVEKFKNGGGG